MVCYAYIRCSTVEQKDSLLVQEDKIKKYCEYQNLNPIIHIESGVSGSVEFKKRPEGKKIYDNLKKGDILIINKIDRISRNVIDFVSSIEYFKKNEITLICLEPSLDLSSPSGMFMANILSSVAQLEKQMTVERVKATIKKRKELNLCVGQIPFGWKKGENKNLVEDKNEQDIIKQIKSMYNDDKMNYKQIADKLNDLKTMSRKWQGTQISRILNRK